MARTEMTGVCPRVLQPESPKGRVLSPGFEALPLRSLSPADLRIMQFPCYLRVEPSSETLH